MKFSALLLIFVLSACGALDSSRRIEVAISPQSAQLAAGGQVELTGSETVTTSISSTISLRSDAFEWTIEEGAAGGTIVKKENDSVHYLYTAPAVPGSYHVRIRSKQDSSQSARATLIVN